MMFINGKNHTSFAGAWTVLSMFENYTVRLCLIKFYRYAWNSHHVRICSRLSSRGRVRLLLFIYSSYWTFNAASHLKTMMKLGVCSHWCWPQTMELEWGLMAERDSFISVALFSTSRIPVPCNGLSWFSSKVCSKNGISIERKLQRTKSYESINSCDTIWNITDNNEKTENRNWWDW